MVASEQALLPSQAGPREKEWRVGPGPVGDALTEDLSAKPLVAKVESASLLGLPVPAETVETADDSGPLTSQATTLAPAVPELPAYRVALPGWWLVVGSPGGDRLVGNPQDDELMFGLDGNDSLEAKGGDDRLYGGAGDDLLAGGRGEDYLQGEAGKDDLFGGDGNDRLDGGLGNDRIRGGAGNDWILLSGGSDDVVGGAGLDAFDARVQESALVPASSAAAQGAMTLSYQVDFVETRVNNKRRVTLVPQASLAVFFHEAWAGETEAETFAPGTTLSSLGQPQLLSPSPAQVPEPLEDVGASRSVPTGGFVASKPPQAQRLRSIEMVIAPWGEANRIDFSLKKIKSAFAAFGNVQAPAIDLNLARQILRYETPSVALSQKRRKRRSPKDSSKALLPQPLSQSSPQWSQPVAPAIAAKESMALSSTAQTLGLVDTLPMDFFPMELWAETGAISPDGMTTVIVQGFQHATGSFGNDRLTGDEQVNILFGGHGKDVLDGGAGHDLLISNEGDQLTGGLGEDCFRLNAAWRKKIRRGRTTPGEIAPVRIQDFNGADGDRIHLENDVFGTVALTAERSLQYQPFAALSEGLLAPEQLLVWEPGVVQDPALVTDEIRLIYDGSSGELFYRGAEILGGLESRVAVAILAGAPQLQASDFLVV